MKAPLNSEQRAAIQHVASSTLILAGAGSGKTRVLLEKILYLVQNKHYRPEQLLAITFTQQAASELKERLNRLGKRENLDLKSVGVHTFHAMALGLLRRHRRSLGPRSRLLLCTESDKRHIIQTLLGQSAPDRATLDAQEQLSGQIAFWKNSGVDPDRALQQASKEQMFAAKIYKAYQHHLEHFGWVDFEDLIQLSLEKLENDPDCLAQEQARFHYVLIDEFQDTNPMQWKLIKTLLGQRFFTAVGDDDQAIYGWRGADPKILEELIDTSPNLKVIKLEKSYRCREAIVTLANELIGHNPHIVLKKLRASSTGGRVRLISLPDSDAEADWIVEQIEQEQLKSPQKKIAILYRSHQQAQSLKSVLKDKKIESVVIGEEEWLEKVEPRLMLDYWSILSDLDSDANLLRVINTPRRGIGASTLQRLSEWAQKHQKSYSDALMSFGFLSMLKNSERQAVENFVEWIVTQQKKILELEREPASNWSHYLHSLMTQLDLDAHFSQGISEKFLFVRRKRLQKICTLFLSKLKYSQTEQSPGGDFTLALKKLQSIGVDSQDRLSKREPPVFLMTLHASKGLEFDSVYLCGLEQGVLPHRSAMSEIQIQEERRLFYVGITRARAQVTLTHALARSRQGGASNIEPSSFLREIAAANFERLKISSEALQQVRKGVAQKYLTQLRQTLESRTAQPCSEGVGL